VAAPVALRPLLDLTGGLYQAADGGVRVNTATPVGEAES
jgi:hypothetical protein